MAIRECRGADPMQRAQCERDIVTEAGEITRRLREETEESVAGLSAILRQLTTVDGHKSLILLSEGLALDDQNELRRLVSLAGAARTSINVMALDLQRGDVTVGESPPTETQDRRIQMQGLEGLATMSMGSLFYIAGTGDPIFERLSSEISAYYLLGVEQRPKDARAIAIASTSRCGGAASPSVRGRRSSCRRPRTRRSRRTTACATRCCRRSRCRGCRCA